MDKNELMGILSQCRPFRGLPRPEILSIIRDAKGWLRFFNKEGWVYSRGERCDFLIILLKGSVRAQMQNAEGKVVRIDTLHAPQMIAPAFLFASHSLFPIDIIAHTDHTVMMEIPKATILELCQQSIVFLENYLQDIGDKFGFLAEKVMAFSFYTIQQKVAHFLMEQMEKQNSISIRLPMTREELADLFGVTRPSLSRVLSEMVHLDWIGVNGRMIDLKDVVALKRVLSQTF